MAKDIWQFRFRAHFARDVDECREALGKAVLALCATTDPKRCVRLTTTADNEKTKADFSPAALEQALDTHIKAPTWCYYESVIDDGQTRDRQSFRVQLLTWNKRNRKRAPRPDDFRTPSHIQCFWDAGDPKYTPTSEQLDTVVAHLASSAGLFYAWADLCQCPPESMGLKREKRSPKDIEPVRPHADLYDGDDMDYRNVVRGAFWFNSLGPGHLGALGGGDRVLRAAAGFSPKAIDEQHITLSLGATPSVETTEEVFVEHARLAAFLKDVYPPPKSRATWRFKFHEKLKDGRVLTNIMWLRRFIDEGFLSEHGFRLP